MKSPTILFVAMQSSSHVARWIDLIAWKKWDLHFFPLNDYTPDSNLRMVKMHWPIRGGRMPGATHVEAALDAPQPEPMPSPQSEEGLIAGGPPTSRLLRLGRLACDSPAEAWNVVLNHMGRGRRPVTFTAPPITTHPFDPGAEEFGGAGSEAVQLGESGMSAPPLNGPNVLAALIRRIKPDLIHSMEFQHAGYLVLRARELYGAGFPPWLATNWGSDIFYYSRFDDHRAQIKRLLAAIDFYSCECKRDIKLARQLGYGGPVFSALPNSGGFDLEHVRSLRSPGPSSRRKLIMIKGYQHFAGRAMTALDVLEKFSQALKGYRIVLYSPGEEPWKRALNLKAKGVLDIDVQTATTHDTILSLFGQARIYMGISISDAISTSALEAMAMGAFPIQTNTSCCDEWFRDGKGGFIVPPDDFETICNRFHRALTDDALVDRAADANWKTVQSRLDERFLSARAVWIYKRIFARIQRGLAA